MANRISFIELPAAATAPSKAFYAAAFGYAMTDFGPTYACTMSGDVNLGLQADAREAPQAPLPVIQVESLETVETRVRNAGGIVTKPIFGFPGGRRFHFRDPAGNELAAMQPD
jgi:predicted enzyme related to lactoylglutathione lyase